MAKAWREVETNGERGQAGPGLSRWHSRACRFSDSLTLTKISIVGSAQVHDQDDIHITNYFGVACIRHM